MGRSRLRLVAATAVAAAAITMIGGTTSSSARTRAASCDTDGYNLQAYTYYKSAGRSRWKVYKYRWRLSGGDVRSENNMNIKLQNRRNDQPSAVFYSVSLGGKMVNDNRAYQHRNTSLVKKRGLRVTRYQAVFDKNNDGDPHCSGYTRDL